MDELLNFVGFPLGILITAVVAYIGYKSIKNNHEVEISLYESRLSSSKVKNDIMLYMLEELLEGTEEPTKPKKAKKGKATIKPKK